MAIIDVVSVRGEGSWLVDKITGGQGFQQVSDKRDVHCTGMHMCDVFKVLFIDIKLAQCGIHWTSRHLRDV
jgi:hypothetical protein